jgi:hypothetical protein
MQGLLTDTGSYCAGERLYNGSQCGEKSQPAINVEPSPASGWQNSDIIIAI